MCGRFFVKSDLKTMMEAFAFARRSEALGLDNQFPRYNGAPSLDYVYADWQGTQWGQSLEELRASGMQLEPVVGAAIEDRSLPAYGKPLLSGPYKPGAEEFSADYLFDKKKLSSVVLYMSAYEQAVRVSAQLRAQYGRPKSMTLISTRRHYAKRRSEFGATASGGTLLRFEADIAALSLCGAHRNTLYTDPSSARRRVACDLRFCHLILRERYRIKYRDFGRNPWCARLKPSFPGNSQIIPLSAM
ncbi:hypothetical protein ACIPSK_20645 [Rhizobium sp. LARHSG275]|uniref:hypothetical protein n=1 Tax=Rhizobium TaxID=379 RepID=UPI001AEEBAE0|nr:hypothetical protein [Rhizobium laguerreae]